LWRAVKKRINNKLGWLDDLERVSWCCLFHFCMIVLLDVRSKGVKQVPGWNSLELTCVEFCVEWARGLGMYNWNFDYQFHLQWNRELCSLIRKQRFNCCAVDRPSSASSMTYLSINGCPVHGTNQKWYIRKVIQTRKRLDHLNFHLLNSTSKK
jgi:hypothetical protein